MTQLSEHFTLAEAAFSRDAQVLGINNTPPAIIIPKLALVAVKVLEPIRTKFGPFSPTSWYRCQQLNDNPIIGSKPTSQHVLGEAVDVKIHDVLTTDLAAWCRDNLTYDQLIQEFYTLDKPDSGWVHISYVDGPSRGQLLTIGPHGTLLGLHT